MTKLEDYATTTMNPAWATPGSNQDFRDETPKTLVKAKTSVQPFLYKRDGSTTYNQECKRLLTVTRCCFL